MADKQSREVVVDYYGNEWKVVAKSDEGVTVGKIGEDGIEEYDSLTFGEFDELCALTRVKRRDELRAQVAEARAEYSAFLDKYPDLRTDSAKIDYSGLSAKLDVDVSEAITGLKALQREAKDATKALREVEAVGNVDPDVAHLLWTHYGITPEVAAKMGEDVRARYIEFIAYKAQQDGVKISGSLINVSADDAEDVARRLVEGMRRKHGGGGA